MDVIEQIGPVVGIVAFVGLAILAFLVFQQARDVRRLREWAGRAPERADEAAEATQAAAEARGEVAALEEGDDEQPGFWSRRVMPALNAVDRRLPVDGRIVLVVILAAVIAAAVMTSGFGLIGADEGKRGGGAHKQPKPEVAVLNATQSGPVPGVAGLADKVADQAVKPEGYDIKATDDSPVGFSQSQVMYDKPDARQDAQELADAVQPKLGDTPVAPMTDEVRQATHGAELALVIGLDDDQF